MNDLLRSYVTESLLASNFVPKPMKAEGFVSEWCVKGNPVDGLFGRWSDVDGVIEFGLFRRQDRVTENVLHVTVVLDEDDSYLYCLSDPHTEMNFSCPIVAAETKRLDSAVKVFVSHLQ